MFGIAYHEAREMVLITGQQWPYMYRISSKEGLSGDSAETKSAGYKTIAGLQTDLIARNWTRMKTNIQKEQSGLLQILSNVSETI